MERICDRLSGEKGNGDQVTYLSGCSVNGQAARVDNGSESECVAVATTRKVHPGRSTFVSVFNSLELFRIFSASAGNNRFFVCEV